MHATKSCHAALRVQKLDNLHLKMAIATVNHLAESGLLLHHLGKGLPQDLHLAKRYYDLAKSTDKEAEFPVALALRALSLQKWWARVEPRVRAYVAAARNLLGMGSPKETGASTEGRTPAPEGGVGVGAPWSIFVSIDTDTALLCALTLLLAALMHVIHVRNLQRRRN